MTPPVLSTLRLTLRPPTPADRGVYAAFYGRAEESLSYHGGRSAAEAEAILAKDIAHWKNKGFGLWLLARREDGSILGAAGLAQDEGWPVELTWWLAQDARGAGYAAEASRAAIAFGYDTLGWPAVETWMRDENEPARRLAERLGGKIVRRDPFPDGFDRNVYLMPREARG